MNISIKHKNNEGNKKERKKKVNFGNTENDRRMADWMTHIHNKKEKDNRNIIWVVVVVVVANIVNIL